MKSLKILHILCALSLLLATSCKDEVTAPGPIGNILKNDCIKRSIGPNVAGLEIEFVYAIALPRSEGKIISAQVEASIAGAAGTWMEHNSYYTNTSGVNIPVPVGNPSVTSSTKTEVVFTTDTCAAALRYYYKIPESAKGKEVSFVFSAKASNGETVSYPMGSYLIEMMDITFDLEAVDGTACYLSLADMVIMDEVTAAANPGKIDLVYLYRSDLIGHALAAPTADPQYIPNVVIPAGATNNTLVRKFSETYRERHLSRDYGIWVWDKDLISLDFTNMPNYALNLVQHGGVWAQTQDGKYRAFVYVNQLRTNGARISMKRYTMK